MQLFNTSQGFCAENNSLQNLASPRFYYFSFISEQLVRVFVHPLPSRPRRREFGRKPLAATLRPESHHRWWWGSKSNPRPWKRGQKNPPNFAPRLDRSRCKMLLSLLRLPERGVNRSQVHSKHPRRIPAPLEDFFFFFFPSSSFSLHPLLIKVGSFHDNHSQRACIANELDFGDVDISRLHCLFSDTV